MEDSNSTHISNVEKNVTLLSKSGNTVDIVQVCLCVCVLVGGRSMTLTEDQA